MIILLVVLVVFAYSTNLLGIKDMVDNFGKGVPIEPTAVSKCPSSGLTEVTIQTGKALATTATDAIADYYVYDGDKFVTTGNSGSDGKSVFDVGCEVGKTYKAIVVNETLYTGYYPEFITIKASSPTDVHSFKMYTYGEVKIVGMSNGVTDFGVADNDWIGGAGAGKVCDWKIGYTINETTSAFNKPLIVCEANATAVTDITLNGVIKANAKAPSRLTPAAGSAFYVFEQDKLLTSEESQQTLYGKIQFGSTAPKAGDSTFKCRIADQAYYKMADYKTLSLENGWKLSAQNDETITNIGAQDTGQDTIYFTTNSTSGYC